MGFAKGLWDTENAFRVIWIACLLKSKCSLGFGSACYLLGGFNVEKTPAFSN